MLSHHVPTWLVQPRSKRRMMIYNSKALLFCGAFVEGLCRSDWVSSPNGEHFWFCFWMFLMHLVSLFVHPLNQCLFFKKAIVKICCPNGPGFDGFWWPARAPLNFGSSWSENWTASRRRRIDTEAAEISSKWELETIWIGGQTSEPLFQTM
jgi:hypothetical protein